VIQLGSGGIGSDPMGKTKALTRLKGAENYPIWWLRFVPMARARGFDRIIKYRERYIDEIRSDAAAMQLKNIPLQGPATLSKCPWWPLPMALVALWQGLRALKRCRLYGFENLES
jgi:hypothetical protein